MTPVHLISAGSDEWHLLRQIRKDGPALFPTHPRDLPQYDPAGKPLAISDDTVAERPGAYLKSGDGSPVCVICDAEKNGAANVWKKLRDVPLSARYSNLPDSFPVGGLMLRETGLNTVGIWIMPNNELPGMIEDFYLRAIGEDDRELLRSRVFLNGIPPNERKFRDVHFPKILYRVWLAIQKFQVGPAQAIEKKLIGVAQGDIPAFLLWLDLFLEADPAPTPTAE